MFGFSIGFQNTSVPDMTIFLCMANENGLGANPQGGGGRKPQEMRIKIVRDWRKKRKVNLSRKWNAFRAIIPFAKQNRAMSTSIVLGPVHKQAGGSKIALVYKQNFTGRVTLSPETTLRAW